MKKSFITYCITLMAVIINIGCSKNYTHYYEDPDTTGVAIFSNKGNDLMTCLLGGQAWRTRDRKTGGIFGGVYTTELQIRRIRTSSQLDTLTIRWYGDFSNAVSEDVMLTFAVPKNFQWSDVCAWQGKRIVLDSTNGYISMIYDYFRPPSVSGKGSVYFNTFKIDSISPFNVTGRVSGLLEANFVSAVRGAFQITSGRFDDDITESEIYP